MSELGAISQQMLAMQNMQTSLMKANFEMQEKVVEILDESRDTSSLTKGQNVDKSL